MIANEKRYVCTVEGYWELLMPYFEGAFLRAPHWEPMMKGNTKREEHVRGKVTSSLACLWILYSPVIVLHSGSRTGILFHYSWVGFFEDHPNLCCWLGCETGNVTWKAA